MEESRIENKTGAGDSPFIFLCLGVCTPHLMTVSFFLLLPVLSPPFPPSLHPFILRWAPPAAAQ